MVLTTMGEGVYNGSRIKFPKQRKTEEEIFSV